MKHRAARVVALLSLALAALATFGALSLTACSQADCDRIAMSGPLGAFAVKAAVDFVERASPLPGLGLGNAVICGNNPDPTTDPPGLTAEALGAPGGRCYPNAGDDECVACAKAQCCELAVACNDAPACACMAACRHAQGLDAGPPVDCTAADQCGALDPAYAPAAACILEHCRTQCVGIE